MAGWAGHVFAGKRFRRHRAQRTSDRGERRYCVAASATYTSATGHTPNSRRAPKLKRDILLRRVRSCHKDRASRVRRAFRGNAFSRWRTASQQNTGAERHGDANNSNVGQRLSVVAQSIDSFGSCPDSECIGSSLFWQDRHASAIDPVIDGNSVLETDVKARIAELMSVFDRPGSSVRTAWGLCSKDSWRPCGAAEAAALQALISEANRSALREWYSQMDSLNPLALYFHDILEHRIGERLPLK